MKINLSTLQTDRKPIYSTIDIDSSRYHYSSRPTPGDTFRLDPERMKQLEAVSRSIKHNSQSFNGDSIIPFDLKSQRYFATKGLNLLG